MSRLKNRLLVVNLVGMFVIAYAMMVGQGNAAPNASVPAVAQSSNFQYEGRLGSLSGTYDLQFRLFDAATGGNLVSPTMYSFTSVIVDTGEYRVRLDFGMDAFNGDERYLEVKYRVHTTSASAPYSTQARQQIHPIAYALQSLGSWNLKGNKGTTAGTNFLGTTDDQSLVMKTNNTQRMWIDKGGNVGVNTSSPGAQLEAQATSGNIGLMGTSDARGIIGRLGSFTSCAGSYGVGGCGADAGIGVFGDSNTRGIVGTLGHTSCAGTYAVGGCNAAGVTGVYGHSDTDKGVWGDSSSGGSARGVVGTINASSCAGSYAVGGCAGSSGVYGVFGRSAFGAGVVGSSDTGDVFIGVTTTNETHVARIDHNGRVFANGGYQSDGADVAEFIPTVDAPQPGDLVEMDAQHPGKFRMTTSANSTAVAGVITTKPGVSLSMNDMDHTDANGPQLALVGRVPCKVTAENGAIHPGDLLVSSSLPGYAMRAPANPAPGTIVGKANGNLASGTGTIELLVMLR